MYFSVHILKSLLGLWGLINRHIQILGYLAYMLIKRNCNVNTCFIYYPAIFTDFSIDFIDRDRFTCFFVLRAHYLSNAIKKAL